MESVAFETIQQRNIVDLIIGDSNLDGTLSYLSGSRILDIDRVFGTKVSKGTRWVMMTNILENVHADDRTSELLEYVTSLRQQHPKIDKMLIDAEDESITSMYDS